MKFQCLSCKKKFIYPAKTRTPLDKEATNLATTVGSSEALEPYIDKHVCPHCGSIDIDEYVEPMVEKQVTNAIQVGWDLVDDYLDDGFVIVERYAKNATLFKYSEDNEDPTVEEK